MRTRLTALLATLGVVVASTGIVMFTAPAASAHSMNNKIDCDKATVHLTAFVDGSGQNPKQFNYVSAWVDGVQVLSNEPFGSGFGPQEFPVDKTKTSHTLRVTTDAWDNNSYDFDQTWTTAQGCKAPVTIPGQPTPTGPSCEAAGTLSVPADTTEIDWSVTKSGIDAGPSPYDPGTYLVKATTKAGYTYTDGSTEKSWTITVQPKTTGIDCYTVVAHPTAPSKTDPTCSTDGALSLPAAPANVEWVVNNVNKGAAAQSFGPGTYDVVAKTVGDFKFADNSQSKSFGSYTIVGNTAGQDECKTKVDLVKPMVVKEDCDPQTPGGVLAGSVSGVPTPGVTYVVVGNKVTATIDGSTHKWDSLAPGWTKVNSTTAEYIADFGEADDCEWETTVKVKPTVVPPTCAVDGSLTLPADGAHYGWSIVRTDGALGSSPYGPGEYVATATADQGYEFDNEKETQSFTLKVLPKGNDGSDLCLTLPADQAPQPPTCQVAGSYTLPASTRVITWTIERTDGTLGTGPSYGPGTYTVTATAADGAHFADDTTKKSWTVTVLPKKSTEVCFGAEPKDLVESVSDERSSCTTGVERRTVTTTKEYVLTDNGWVVEPQADWAVVDTGWVKVRDLTPEEAVALGCVAGVQEIAPVVSFTDPTCDNLDGAAWSAPMSDIVDYTVDGDVAPGEAVVVTASIKPALAGTYAFASGHDTTAWHKFPSVGSLGCEEILGEETKGPKPESEPTVLGTEAAVPTAVAAGLGDVNPMTPAGSGNLIALSLLVTGLGLLAAAGGLLVGRRAEGSRVA